MTRETEGEEREGKGDMSSYGRLYLGEAAQWTDQGKISLTVTL